VLLQREEFETLATTVGFKVLALYEDYSSAPFQEEHVAVPCPCIVSRVQSLHQKAKIC
jgi:hypothetical protein